jgi:hypothetical protein
MSTATLTLSGEAAGAPANIEVPPHRYLTATCLLIGDDTVV